MRLKKYTYISMYRGQQYKAQLFAETNKKAREILEISAYEFTTYVMIVNADPLEAKLHNVEIGEIFTSSDSFALFKDKSLRNKEMTQKEMKKVIDDYLTEKYKL